MLNSLAIIIGRYFFVVPVICAAVYFLISPHARRAAIFKLSLVALPLTVVLDILLSKIWYNPRPFVAGHFTPLIAHAADNGFPSDHATFTALIASVIFVFNKKLGIILFIFSIAISIARVYAGVHHTVDVIAGTLLAILVTVSSYGLTKPYFKHLTKEI